MLTGAKPYAFVTHNNCATYFTKLKINNIYALFSIKTSSRMRKDSFFVTMDSNLQ